MLVLVLVCGTDPHTAADAHSQEHGVVEYVRCGHRQTASTERMMSASDQRKRGRGGRGRERERERERVRERETGKEREVTQARKKKAIV